MSAENTQFAQIIAILREGSGYGKRAADEAENIRGTNMRNIDNAVEAARDCRDWAEEVDHILSKIPDGYDLEVRLVRKVA